MQKIFPNSFTIKVFSISLFHEIVQEVKLIRFLNPKSYMPINQKIGFTNKIKHKKNQKRYYRRWPILQKGYIVHTNSKKLNHPILDE